MYFLSNSSENGPMLKENSYTKVEFFCLTFTDLCEGLTFVLFLLAQTAVHFIACSQELRSVFVKSSRKALRKKLSRYKALEKWHNRQFLHLLLQILSCAGEITLST